MNLSLFIYTLPLLPLLGSFLIKGRTPGLAETFFISASSFELLLAYLLHRWSQQQRPAPAKLLNYDYILRTVVGLPLTIYYSVVFPYGAAAILRFFPFILLLRGHSRKALQLWHLIFFIAGLLAFSAFLRRDLPGLGDWIMALNAIGLTYLVTIVEQYKGLRAGRE